MSRDFELDVIDRLARIETKVDATQVELAEHTNEDGTRFDTVEAGLLDLVVQDRVAKEKARLEGGKAGKKTAAVVTAALLGVVEAAKALLR